LGLPESPLCGTNRRSSARYFLEIAMQSNPLALDGLEFIEFACPDTNSPDILETMMEKMGSKLVARHPSQDLRLYRQNDINFVINNEPDSFAMKFAKEHGPCASATGFRVFDAKEAYEMAIERGARPFNDEAAKAGWDYPAIYGIGDSLVYFIEKYGQEGEIYDGWNWLAEDRRPAGRNLLLIDHMTNNVPRGEMQKWCDFYTNIFGFEERRYFDIKGKSTGLFSKVMRSPCGKFSIPINEPQDTKSQIQEYLDEYKGSGIQHIALLTHQIASSVGSLGEAGIEFLAAPPQSYYNALPTRVTTFKDPIEPLQKLGILVDGDDKGFLLQIFTKNQVGPIFLEVIERRGHDGFGDGNFQALFDAMEEDQRSRGVL
jgi:4-hydroxyphenylpyruvate dioxygenase